MDRAADSFRRIRRWIETVDFGDVEKNYLAANLQWAALFTSASCVLASLVFLFVIQRPYTVAVLLISSALYLAVVWLVRRRRLTSASALYLSAMLGIVTYELHMANGIRSIGVILYPVVVIFASLILSRRLFILYAGLVLASVGSVIYGQMQGWVKVATLEPPSFAVFLLYGLIISGTGLVVRMLAESWRNALARAQRNERELAAQKTMLDQVGQAVVGCQSDNTIIYWNQAATDLYGWSPEEAVGRKYYEVVPTPMSPEMTESIRASLRQGVVWSGEMTMQRRDQVSVPILGTLAPLHDERGVMTGWVGIGVDLSERKRAEETIRQRADEMSLLYRMGISVATGHDLSGTLNALQAEISSLIRADAMFIAIYDEDTDIMSYPVYFNAGEPTVAESRRLQDRPGLTGAVINSGKTLYLPDISMPQVQAAYAPVDDNALVLHTFLGVPLVIQERIIGVVSVQSKRANAYTPDQIHLLEALAAQVAIAIDKARLLDQLKLELAERQRLVTELEAKNTELERFTYTVSHDLKAPLITIRGFLGFVEKDALAGNLERVRADMQRIIEATDKMQRLLSELLKLSRVGRMMNPPQSVPFEAVVREALELVHGRIQARGVQVRVAPDLPTVYGDRVRLVEVVQNLVDNACKFMGNQPEPRIEIGQRGADNAGKPVFYMRDNGIGIEPQYHDKVFGLFNKLDAQTEGTGVGLALVKRIVEFHGGRIWVESEGAGQGAMFCFTLPSQ